VAGAGGLEPTTCGFGKRSASQENKANAESSGEEQASGGEAAPAAGVVGQSSGIEDALAAALVGATQAQRWDVVAQLAKEIEARRLARDPKVVPIDSARTKGGKR